MRGPTRFAVESPSAIIPKVSIRYAHLVCHVSTVRQTRSTGKRIEHDLVRGLLRSARLHLNISSRQLSAQLDKAPTFVARVERGERLLDIVEFVDICEKLGLNPGQVLSDVLTRRQGQGDSFTDSPEDGPMM